MRVLHGMCYSLPAVVMISYLMWLTKSWASGIALTNLLTVRFRARFRVRVRVRFRARVSIKRRKKTETKTHTRKKQ